VDPTGVAAGTYRGTVTVNSGATNSPQTVEVTLNVSAVATPQPVTVVNGASFVASAASPGLIFSITGTDLGPANPVSMQLNPQGNVPTTLANVQVLFDGIAAPLLYASATQLSGIVPFELAGRFSTRMVVDNQGVRSREIELRVVDASPGIFSLNMSGTGAGAILNENGSVNAPNNAAAKGSIVVIYATGFGSLAPAPGTGRVVQPSANLPRPLLPVRVRIGGLEADVLYAGAAPGFVAGAIQVNARVPANAASGNQPVQMQVGDAITSANVTVAIQ
jgi:uncharacterized protein (TIGR03437 family)